jgi:hypothetical protein
MGDHNPTTQPDYRALLAPMRALHAQIRDAVLVAFARAPGDALAAVAAEDDAGDTIYAVDRVSEELLLGFFAREVAPHTPLVLIAEGLGGGGKVTLPLGTPEEQALIRVIVDPIDGTRGLMYQKRPAWILTGIAPNLGPATGLADIVLAIQTEIPLLKQHLCDTLWAIKGQGAWGERLNRLSGEQVPLALRPSRASTIAHGFASFARFFPGPREELTALDEALMRRVLGPPVRGKAQSFEDQYISSGGQLYELIVGHDRFVADLRPLVERALNRRGLELGICAHPYDLCTELIAREAGVIVCDALGRPLDAPLAVEPDIAWVAYANAAIRAQIEPALAEELARRGWSES